MNDERYWNIKLLNKWFAISSIIFMVSFIWMFIDDNDDEFKKYQRSFRKMEIETAEKKKIPFQRHASSRYTGTDTDAFAYSNGGVASALISLPLRYMHTTVETVHKNDVDNVIRLIYESLRKIKNGHNFKYL